MKKNIIIGYSGHAYVVCDIFESNSQKVFGYFENEKKENNPFNLNYLGSEKDETAIKILTNSNWFVAVGDNFLRKKITEYLSENHVIQPVTIKHKMSIISGSVQIGDGTMVAGGAIVNPEAILGNGVICNTGSIIEHECVIHDFAHIAPGAVLAGNVEIGEYSFVGANAVIIEGITIGKNVRIGAGSVVIRDIPNGVTVVGNPGRILDVH